MAVGDIIAVIVSTINWSNYQPASGVEIMVTFSTSSNGDSNHVGLTDGTIFSYTLPSGTSTVGQTNMKIGITNSVYLHQYGAAGKSLSGIQTKWVYQFLK